MWLRSHVIEQELEIQKQRSLLWIADWAFREVISVVFRQVGIGGGGNAQIPLTC